MTRRPGSRLAGAVRGAGLAGLVVALGVAAGCGVPVDDGFRAVPPDEVPFNLAEPATTTIPTTTTSVPSATVSTTAVASESVRVFFVGDAGLVQVFRTVPAPVTLTELIDLLVIGPTSDDVPQGLRTVLQPGQVVSVQVRAGVASVDLAPSFFGDGQLPTGEQQRAVLQLVYTLTGRPGIGQVAFTVGGQPVSVPRGDGSVTAGPVSRDDYPDVRADR